MTQDVVPNRRPHRLDILSDDHLRLVGVGNIVWRGREGEPDPIARRLHAVLRQMLRSFWVFCDQLLVELPQRSRHLAIRRRVGSRGRRRSNLGPGRRAGRRLLRPQDLRIWRRQLLRSAEVFAAAHACVRIPALWDYRDITEALLKDLTTALALEPPVDAAIVVLPPQVLAIGRALSLADED
eukprot:851316-Prymnesium_polylepis.1